MAQVRAIKDQVVKDSKLLEAKKGDDTIRIWESYRDQAMLWRAISLLQIPATFIAVVFAILMWQTRAITLNVPARPLPGQYTVQQIPDVEFIETATGFINLIATYQASIARKQFAHAAEMTKEPFLTRFKKEMLEDELRAIEQTARTQIFFLDPTKTQIMRSDDGGQVSVTLVGTRLKMISNKELPASITEFVVEMTTVPRNDLNPLGIVVSNVTSKVLERYADPETGERDPV